MKDVNAMVSELVYDVQTSVTDLFHHFDIAQLCHVIDIIQACSGVLFFTGVGKSGIIARKVVMTMNSFGIKAFFLSPQNALHGDIGVVGPKDVVIFFSKSGETDELIELCPALRNKGAYLIAVVATMQSRLALACSHVFMLPPLRELCPFDIAPTTSVLSQLIFGDILAMALMRLKNISLDSFVQNHPAGRIGKRQLLKVCDLMITGDALPQCTAHDKLLDCLVELSNKQCGCICILDTDQHLLGIFTDGDLRRSLQQYGPTALELPIESLMTKHPRTITADALAVDALAAMKSNHQQPITVLVVTSENKCCGVIKMHDIIQSGI